MRETERARDISEISATWVAVPDDGSRDHHGSTPDPSPSSPTADLRETLFGDLPLSAWGAGQTGEPWTQFAMAAQCLARKDRNGAMAALQAIVARTDLGSRHVLQAWDALRLLAISPPAAIAKNVLGVVVDVPVENRCRHAGCVRSGCGGAGVNGGVTRRGGRWRRATDTTVRHRGDVAMRRVGCAPRAEWVRRAARSRAGRAWPFP